MAAPRFLVARRDETGNFQVASTSGQVYSSGACHPCVDGMSEAAHEAICNAAFWMYQETIRPQFVELDVDGVWRISPMTERREVAA